MSTKEKIIRFYEVLHATEIKVAEWSVTAQDWELLAKTLAKLPEENQRETDASVPFLVQAALRRGLLRSFPNGDPTVVAPPKEWHPAHDYFDPSYSPDSKDQPTPTSVQELDSDFDISIVQILAAQGRLHELPKVLNTNKKIEELFTVWSPTAISAALTNNTVHLLPDIVRKQVRNSSTFLAYGGRYPKTSPLSDDDHYWATITPRANELPWTTTVPEERQGWLRRMAQECCLSYVPSYPYLIDDIHATFEDPDYIITKLPISLALAHYKKIESRYHGSSGDYAPYITKHHTMLARLYLQQKLNTQQRTK